MPTTYQSGLLVSPYLKGRDQDPQSNERAVVVIYQG